MIESTGWKYQAGSEWNQISGVNRSRDQRFVVLDAAGRDRYQELRVAQNRVAANYLQLIARQGDMWKMWP